MKRKHLHILAVDLVVCEHIDQTHPLAHPKDFNEITYLLFFLLGSRYRHLAIVSLTKWTVSTNELSPLLIFL